MKEEPVSTSINKETSAYAIDKKIMGSIKPKNQNKSNQMRQRKDQIRVSEWGSMKSNVITITSLI